MNNFAVACVPAPQIVHIFIIIHVMRNIFHRCVTVVNNKYYTIGIMSGCSRDMLDCSNVNVSLILLVKEAVLELLKQFAAVYVHVVIIHVEIKQRGWVGGWRYNRETKVKIYAKGIGGWGW